MPKLAAVPRLTTGWQAWAEVLKLQVKADASGVPPVVCAPVVMVAR